MEFVNIIYAAIVKLVTDLVGVIPLLIVALIIWLIGTFLLDLAIRLLQKINLRNTTVDDKAIGTITYLINIAGRIILALIVLDYLGIGRTIIAALTNGFSFAVAIALGLAISKAIEPDAKKIVDNVRRILENQSKKA